jgi:hypothetical protein
MMATYADRYDIVPDTINSILPQVDELHICDNTGGLRKYLKDAGLWQYPYSHKILINTPYEDLLN